MQAEKHIVKIKEIFPITKDVRSFITNRPKEYFFKPGQATEIAINKPGWEKEGRPFTFTSLPNDDFLQFIVKIYPEHHGVTQQLQHLKRGDELILHDVFGSINYQGKGTFIAGGAGITPFISIFRNLELENRLEGNRLIFANKTKDDIILQQELEDYFGEEIIHLLSEEDIKAYAYGLISEDFLNIHLKNKNSWVYLCGPPTMNKTVKKQLINLGIDESKLIMEGI